MHYRLSMIRWLFRNNILYDNIRRPFASEATVRQRKKKSATEPDTASSARLSKELEAYFKQTNEEKILQCFPPSLLKRGSKHAERCYVATSETANTISKHVTADLKPDTLLVEVNPGPGLLTSELLRKKNTKLMLFEAESSFESGLRELVGTSKRVQLKPRADFNGQWKLAYLDALDNGTRMQKLLEGLPRKQWKDEVNFRLFSAVGSMQFFRTLIRSVAYQTGIFALGRCEMIMMVPPLVYVHLTCSKDAGYKHYRSNTVLFQLFFEHEFIAKLPRHDFLPWPPSSSGKKNRTQHWKLGLDGVDDWYLMRIVPRRDLFKHCLPDNLKLLAFFVTQNLISRKNRIIPAVERWIPYSGARLILNENYVPHQSKTSPAKTEDPPFFQRFSSPLRGNDFINRINIFTEFGELTPSQILTLFNEFVNWPEFRQSPFLQTMEQHELKQSIFARGSTSPAADDEDESASKLT